MRRTQRPGATPDSTHIVRIAIAAIAWSAVACGGSSGTASGGDASTDAAPGATSDAASTGAGDATTDAGNDASSSSGDASPVDAASANDGSGASDGAADTGAGDAGYACTVPTFTTDCPALACKTIAGCTGGICQYTTLTVCPAGTTSGTFLSGGIDAVGGDAGTSILHGNIGAFRSNDGTLCNGTTCITGGIVP
jgi:hypothetical protein